VAQGLPYYNLFIEQYATVKDLAAASEDEVLRLWQGLGYYSRARNLHKCARMVAEDFGEQFPKTFEELKSLPGIGNYTAAAIASLAFNEQVPVVDGNVYRLLSRYFGLETDISSAIAYREFFALASGHIDKERPGDFNQAMMEFGAIQCSPKQPVCKDCTLQPGCFAYNNSLQDKLPVKLKKTKIRQRHFAYLLVRSGEELLFRQRTEKDIWQGLYEFPLVETPQRSDIEEIRHPVLDQLKEFNVIFTIEDKIRRHVLSHQVLNVTFVVIEIDGKAKKGLKTGDYKWYDQTAVDALPKPVLIVNYLDSYLNSIHLQ
jgi:A/G-specific adenine glycosylase